ncbi:cytoplasmic protein [Paraburkholderia lacunae]|uniref:Cytoplasmic protein n=1 Tax=Paraburkholderia lacunae TaxID=2211104 RepID=A0A370N519_9BURK|nr:cytoplasmic protein [Paraburkholderia lacunae]
MAWDKVGAVHYLQSHAQPTSIGRCAEYTRRAIEWGGLHLMRTGSARNDGSSLICVGFHEVHGNPQRGDVVVIQPIPGHPDGHMTMFDGQIWISDFKQMHGFYPGPAYRSAQPPYKIYRHD